MKPEQIEAERSQRNRLLRWLMLAVAVWGGLLSLGALLFGIDEQGTVSFAVRPVRGLIAIVCVGGFLSIWFVTDLWGKFRLSRRDKKAAEASKPRDD